MISHHEKQKELEYSICNSFLKKYNGSHNIKVKFFRHGDANKNEPDCICTNDISIEITSVQDNPYQAEKIHSITTGQKFNPNLKSVENLESVIVKKLNNLNSGKYGGVTGKIFLVCDLESPLITETDINSFLEDYTPYSQDGVFDKYFSEVWLYWKSEKNGDIKIKSIEI